MISSRARLISLGLVAAAAFTGCSSAGTSIANVAGASAATASASAAATATAATAATATTDLADAAAIARATALLRALGVPVTADSSTTAFAADPATWPGGTAVSGTGWEVVWDGKGVLGMVFVPGSPVAADTPLTQTEASARVAQVVAALGVGLGAPDSLRYDTGSGWSVDWTRQIDGVPAFGDGSHLVLTDDGTFQSYAYSESQTLPKPAVLLTKAQALAKFPGCKNSAAGAAKTETCTAELIWARPASAPSTDPLRLCWRLTYGWTQGEDFGGSAEWLDAGTGELVDSAAVS